MVLWLLWAAVLVLLLLHVKSKTNLQYNCADISQKCIWPVTENKGELHCLRSVFASFFVGFFWFFCVCESLYSSRMWCRVLYVVGSGLLGHSSREKPQFCLIYRQNILAGRIALFVEPVNEPGIPYCSITNHSLRITAVRHSEYPSEPVWSQRIHTKKVQEQRYGNSSLVYFCTYFLFSNK